VARLWLWAFAAMLALLAGCAGLPPGPQGAAAEARAQLGRHYHYGGVAPAMGFDCSGLAQWCWSRQGLKLPRTAREQFRKGRKVRLKDLEPGDLVFFDTLGAGHASHVGLWQGKGRFIHAPSSGGVVREDRLCDPYWARRYMGARRPEP